VFLAPLTIFTIDWVDTSFFLTADATIITSFTLVAGCGLLTICLKTAYTMFIYIASVTHIAFCGFITAARMLTVCTNAWVFTTITARAHAR